MPVGGRVYVVEGEALAASTSLSLVRAYRQVWDTNGYYAALGLRFDATRREIREAYQRLGGQDSPRLTYIVKQLLNPDTRAKYDETPLGSLYFDYEVETWIRRARVQKSSRLRSEGRVEEAEEIEAQDFGELLDTEGAGQDDDPARPLQAVWRWGYFLRDTDCSDRARLAQWQELLVSAFGRAGQHVQLAVGFSGGMASPWGVEKVGDLTIAFLSEGEQPTEALASRVVNPQHQPVRQDHEHGDRKMSGFRKGAEAAKEASKGGGAFARTQFFGMEDGKTEVIRLLTDADEWITVDQHQMVPTKGKPADYPKDARWPEKMGCVCRKDPAFTFGECYVCENIVGKVAKVKKPSGRTWALACLREEVMEDGKVVGLRDKTREVTIPEKDGQPEKKITEKAIVVVNMGYKNFFSILEGFAGRYGTILDRDYWIKRSGSDTDTTYQIVPMDPIETDEGRFDLREPKFMERYKHDLDLEKVITERASDEFYARFFDPRFTTNDKGEVIPASGEQATAASAPAAPSGDVDEERLSALASRVKGYGGGSSSEAQPETAGASSGGGMRDFS